MDLPRILTSSKYHAALVVSVLGAVPVIFQIADKSVPQASKIAAIQTWLKVSGAAWSAAILITGVEDASEKHGSVAAASAAATTNTVSSSTTDTLTVQSPAQSAAPNSSASPAGAVNRSAPAVISPPASPVKATAMRLKFPTRTIPLLFLSCLLAAAAAAAPGCATGTSPDLITYREGLHTLDEPLYKAHATLMADAVKANLRTATDAQIVTAGIAQAEAQYNASKARDAGNQPVAVIPTTQGQ